MKILLKIKYNGTSFCGYQVQPNKRTVQGTLNQAAAELTGKKCNITGCSRTDSGAHALSFYCTIEPCDYSDITVPLASLPSALNVLLPCDIAVEKAYYVPDSFHARYSVISKQYTYILYNSKQKDPFLANKVLHLQKKLDAEAIERMSLSLKYLCGTHDFRAFMAQNSKITDTVRTIYSANIEQSGDLIKIKISGDGFLYNMVRIIVGTLLDIGYGKKQPYEMKEIIEKRNRSLSGQTVSAHGLYLSSVVYGREFEIN